MSFSASDALPLAFSEQEDGAKPAVRTAMVLMTRLVHEEAVVALDEDGQIVDVLLVLLERGYDHAHLVEEMQVTLQ